jgi:hypothetical protein
LARDRCEGQHGGVSESRIEVGAAPPETVLPEPPAAWRAALAPAEELAASDRRRARQAAREAAARYPAYLEAWAVLAELADDPLDSYAYARVGYHRGLDALRAAGWRGTGYVRWRRDANRGFLRALDALGSAAERIGELEEAERCRLFRRQLDPEAPRAGSLEAGR